MNLPLNHHQPALSEISHYLIWLLPGHKIILKISINFNKEDWLYKYYSAINLICWRTNHEGNPSCCTLEARWVNRKWGWVSRLPQWRKVWWPRWTHRTREQRRWAFCGLEEVLRRARGWRRWGTWWLADLRNPAESDSWWESPHWPWRLHTDHPLAPPPPAERWVSHLLPLAQLSHHSALDWWAWALTEIS